MTLFHASELDVMPGFRRVNPDLTAAFTAVSTDTRSLEPHALFVALQGERFDGHDFISAALHRGAAGLVVSRLPDPLPRVPIWQVRDTLEALGDLAHRHRERFSLAILGLTGTSGKTTTKELLRAMFRGRPFLTNEGNLNNLIGVPLTLFNLRAEHAFAFLEMGMNRFGEIARLTRIVAPTVGLINNIGPGHLEGVGDLEGVLRAKTELAREMIAGAPIVLNADDPYLRRFGQGTQRRVVWFGLQSGSTVTARDVEDRGIEGSRFTLVTPQGSVPVQLRLPGEHNLRNALAAAAAALEMGLSLDEVAGGIELAGPFKMRNEIVVGPRGARILNDCYNANPASMREALRLLTASRRAGRIGAVLGDMLELGQYAEQYHRELGRLIAALKLDRVWVMGNWAGIVAEEARGVEVCVVDDLASLTEEVRAWLHEGDTLLVKASRGMQLDRLVAVLAAQPMEH